MNAATIDAELTYHLNQSNEGLYAETAAGLAQARLHIGIASGILLTLAPDESYRIRQYQDELLTTTEVEELLGIQRTIFRTAFDYLNNLARSEGQA